MTVLLVAVGGAAGAAVRALVARTVVGRGGASWHATLLVNLAGSLLLGLLAAAAPAPYALLGVGFCGALTTFSTYAVEVLDAGGWRYAAVSTGGCLLACALGLVLASGLSAPG